MKIYIIFYVFLFESYKEFNIVGGKQPPPSTVLIDNQEEYEVGHVLDS